MNTTELKFGHRVLVRDNENEKWQTGKFICYYPTHGYCFRVLLDTHRKIEGFKQCILDPDATEFLPGSEVEVRYEDNQEWEKAIYKAYMEEYEHKHFAKKINGVHVTYFRQCRYPQPKAAEQPAEQPEPAQTFELNGKRYEIREVQE